ncbi:MAG: DUF1674 domain-containing protein [Chromatiales bacterium]|nr:DUF1674 domain-containing protein [Chromatiales bacterium]
MRCLEISRSFWHTIAVPEAVPQKAPVIDAARAARPVPELLPVAAPTAPPEIGGPPGPEPTRYGDWERGGRCIDF